MIQRIQTLYLLIVTALMAVTLFAPLAWFAGDAGEFGLYAFALKTAEGEARFRMDNADAPESKPFLNNGIVEWDPERA